MKYMSLGTIISGFILTVWLTSACGPLRVQSYLVSSKMKPGWVTIEYGNQKCAPVNESPFGQEFVIPESGFLCTSSSMYTGWHRRKYYLVDENNNKTELEAKQIIFREGTVHINEPSLDAGMPPCKLTMEEFFYGLKEKLTYENPIRQHANFLKLHPECRHTGITAPIK